MVWRLFNDNDDIDLITICGMGGRLIADILAAGSDKLNSVKTINFTA